MKRRPLVTHESHDRWLVSYADFITLLFAFFVVMFASTQTDKSKAKAVSEAVREALQHGQFSSAISIVLGRGKHDSTKNPAAIQSEAQLMQEAAPQPHPADLVQSLGTLQQGLKNELEGGKLQVTLEQRGLVISLREGAFFASGDDAVQPDSLPIIAKIAQVIREVPNPLRLEGHTDSIPIHNSRFHSNWELSSARSIATLELLSQQFQIPRSRMCVAGYAENAPVDDNSQEVGRSHNRRVDVVLLSAEGAKAEPGAGR
jgi:chemotaxis protein MotB